MNRRAFVGGVLSACAAAALPKDGPAIQTIEVFPVTYPVTAYFKFLPKPERPAIFVKVTCEGGTFGWGQSVPLPTWSYETPESVSSTLREYLAPALIGKAATDIDGAHTAMNKAIAASYSTGMPIAKASLDLALYDIAGKLAGKSLAVLWGRKPLDRIPLSWTVNVKAIAEVEPLMAEGRKRGYRNFNIKVSPDIRFDVALAREVRRLAPASFLWSDANGGYDTDAALTAAPQLRDAGVDVLEQPVAANNLSGLAAVKKQAALPIILDEGVVGPRPRRVSQAESARRRRHEAGSYRRAPRCATASRISRAQSPAISRQRTYGSRRLPGRITGTICRIRAETSRCAERSAIPRRLVPEAAVTNGRGSASCPYRPGSWSGSG